MGPGGLFGQRIPVRDKARFPDQVRAESYWPQLGPDFQRATIPAFDPVAVWNDLVPRLAIIYDLRGDGRTREGSNKGVDNSARPF